MLPAAVRAILILLQWRFGQRSYVAHDIGRGAVQFMSYLTTRESLIGHSWWALPHYTEMGHSVVQHPALRYRHWLRVLC